MINDQGVGTAGIVLSGTPRDSLYAIDLMYRRDGGARPEVFISDTGSYFDMVFGLLKLLGVDYRPELAGLPDQRLWRTARVADYGPLDTASRNLIDLEKIKRHWSDILRIAASVHAGEVAASEVMRIHPYWYAHINVHGHYSFQPLQLAEGVGRRPLRDPGNADPDEE